MKVSFAVTQLIVAVTLLISFNAFAVNLEQINNVNFNKIKLIHTNGSSAKLSRCKNFNGSEMATKYKIIGTYHACSLNVLFPAESPFGVGVSFVEVGDKIALQYNTMLTGYTFEIEKIEDQKIYLGQQIDAQP